MNYTFRKATAILFSRIVLTQLDNEQRSAFRNAEKLTKHYTKIKSDLKYRIIAKILRTRRGTAKLAREVSYQ